MITILPVSQGNYNSYGNEDSSHNNNNGAGNNNHNNPSDKYHQDSKCPMPFQNSNNLLMNELSSHDHHTGRHQQRNGLSNK